MALSGRRNYGSYLLRARAHQSLSAACARTSAGDILNLMVLSGFHYPRPLFILYGNVLTSPMSANDPKQTLGGLQERVMRLFVVVLALAVMASTQAMAFGPQHQG